MFVRWYQSTRKAFSQALLTFGEPSSLPFLPSAPYHEAQAPQCCTQEFDQHSRRQQKSKKSILKHHLDCIGNQLRSKNDRTPDCSSVEKKTAQNAYDCQRAKLAIICGIKQKNGCHTAKDTKEKVLKKDQCSKKRTFSTPAFDSNIRKLFLVQGFQCATTVSNPEKNTRDAQKIVYSPQKRAEQRRKKVEPE